MITFHWVMNIFSIIILVIIKIAYTRYGKSASSRYTFFIAILYIAILLLLFESPSRYDGGIEPYWRIFNVVGNFMLFLFSPILPSLWIMLVYSQIYNTQLPSKRMVIILVLANLFHLGMLIANQFTGWFYTIGPTNIYARGPLFFASPMITIGILVSGLLLTIFNSRRLHKTIFASFLFFPLPTIIGVILQAFIYGVDFSLKGLVISIIVYFTFVLSHQITIDYLTGLYNRKGLDEYLKKLSIYATKSNSFTAIMLDLDDFKSINDRFGHVQGDEALKETAAIIKGCLNERDFVARYGGDEFFVILETSQAEKVKKTIDNLNGCFTRFNNSGSRPYTLSYSIGILTYDPEKDSTITDFKKRIDEYLYQNKNQSR